MQAIEAPTAAADVHDRKLYRLIDRLAADEAAAALAHRRDDVVASTSIDVPALIRQLRGVASTNPGTGACTIASALDLWSWTLHHLRETPQAVDELTEALSPLLAARAFAIEVAARPKFDLQSDLCHVYAAHVAATTAATCAELVFGYRRHLVWDAEGCAACYAGEVLDELEAFIPGIAAGTRANADVVEADGSHPVKAGPCVNFKGIETFIRLRNKLDGCLSGARLAKDRAAAELAGRP